MRRKLLAPPSLVKRAVLSLGLGIFTIGAVAACGGTQKPPPKADPYGPRIAQCIDAPRGVSDAANEHMITLGPGLAVLGSTVQERAQAQRDYGPGGEKLFRDESAVRRAHVPGFRMDRSPVTQEAYAEVVGACGVIPPDAEALSQSRWHELRDKLRLAFDYSVVQRFLWSANQPPPLRKQHPMVLVTYEQAAFYCAWRGGRLPTAIEWERAARGQQGRAYPWGDRFDPFRANVALRGAGDTIDVGSRPTGNTPEGFTDLGGHVLEWTSSDAGKPGYRFVKGNGWSGRGGYGRGAASRALPEEQLNVTLGFRCAADL